MLTIQRFMLLLWFTLAGVVLVLEIFMFKKFEGRFLIFLWFGILGHLGSKNVELQKKLPLQPLKPKTPHRIAVLAVCVLVGVLAFQLSGENLLVLARWYPAVMLLTFCPFMFWKNLQLKKQVQALRTSP